MKLFVLITAIVELLAGVALFLAPTVVPGMEDASVGGLTFARMYGAAALAVGFFALQTWQNMDSRELIQVFLKTFSVFHIGVAVSAFLGYGAGGQDFMGVGILHSLMALITLYFLLKKY